MTNLWDDTSAPAVVTKPSNLWEDSGPSVSETPQPDSGYSLAGLGKNAVKDVGRIGTGLAGAVGDAAKSSWQVATGPNPIVDPKGFASNLEKTPVAQRIEEMPQGIEQGINNFVNDPVGSMYRNPVSTAMTAMGAVKGISSILDTTPDLIKAGINPNTVTEMAPAGVNPAKFVQSLQDQLNKEGLLGKNPEVTWDKFYPDTKNAGESIGDARQAIANSPAGPQALEVDAQSALKPIYDAWAKEGLATDPDTGLIRKLERNYTGLMNIAEDQGGKLTLENIHDFLQRVGPKTKLGSDASKALYSQIYKVGWDVQKQIINTVAQQSGDETLAKNLLDANAHFARNMELFPDIVKAAGKYGAKEAVSTFHQLIRSPITKLITGYTGLQGLHDILGKITP